MRNKKELARYSLWVHKTTGMYFEPGETPIIGGVKTSKEDFKWLEVIEIRKKVRKRKQK